MFTLLPEQQNGGAFRRRSSLRRVALPAGGSSRKAGCSRAGIGSLARGCACASDAYAPDARVLSYEATASSTMDDWRTVPLRGPRLRALITLIRSSSSWGEQFFLASSASAA